MTKPETVDEYIASVPQIARVQFDTLRQLIRDELPEYKERISYGIVGYSIDEKRARVFISGWKDHVAVYPLPKDDALRKELEPYIKGKGTLWFTLDEALPAQLIQRTVRSLIR